MAKITINFDTATKKMAVDVDGKAVENVTSAEVYPSWDDEENYRCSVMTRSTDAGTGITTLTMLMAAETKVGKTGVPSEYPGLTQVEVPSSEKAEGTKKAIEKYFEALCGGK